MFVNSSYNTPAYKTLQVASEAEKKEAWEKFKYLASASGDPNAIEIDDLLIRIPQEVDKNRKGEPERYRDEGIGPVQIPDKDHLVGADLYFLQRPDKFGIWFGWKFFHQTAKEYWSDEYKIDIKGKAKTFLTNARLENNIIELKSLANDLIAAWNRDADIKVTEYEYMSYPDLLGWRARYRW